MNAREAASRRDAWAGAVARPTHVSPMLAVRGRVDDLQGGFGYEYCYDGLRVLAHVGPDLTRLESRRYRDLTGRYPELADLHERSDEETILDGELVVLHRGTPDPARLQRRRRLLDDHGTMTPQRQRDPVTFMVFDLLWRGGRPLWDLPYHQRRQKLEQLSLPHERVAVAPTFDDLDAATRRARAAGVRALVAKRLGSAYQPGERSPDWQTISFVRREDFVVGGFLPGQGQRAGSIGALLVGRFPTAGSDHLRYAGSVGTGFRDADLADLGALVREREAPASPFAGPVPREGVRFCRPELVVRVQYREETDAGLLRYPVYKGLLDDVEPGEVVDDR